MAGASEGEGVVGELSDALRAEIEEKMELVDAELMGALKGLDYFGHAGAEFDDAATVFLAELLQGNTSVERLLLYRCEIGAVGARALAKSLAEHNVSLKRLIISDCGVGDDGAQAMARVLEHNTTLEKLFLYGCGVGVRGARALGEALKQNTTLKSLVLAANDVRDDAAEALAEALRCNESLESLELFGSRLLTDAGASSLLAAVRESNSTLTRLELDRRSLDLLSCQLTDAGASWSNSTLTSLDLYDNYGTENRSVINDAIAEMLQENKAVVPASAERRARCLLFCCLKLAPKAHEHVVPSIGAVPVPVMQYAVEHAGILHVAKRFERGNAVAGQSSAEKRARSSSDSSSPGDSELQSATARRR